MRGHRRVWLAVGSTLAGFVLVGTAVQPALAVGSTLVNEPFTGSTTSSANWVLPTASVNETNTACLTGSADTTQTPIPGCASAGAASGLQLTTNDNDQEGGVAYISSVPSSLGLDVSFDTYQYTGSGADGILFYLAASNPTNASASPVTLGPDGGNLGYTPLVGAGVDGLTHGYLGVGLDVYGNYTNAAYAGGGCHDSLGQTPESVTVRGAGNGTTGYCTLTTQQLSGSTLDAPPPAVPLVAPADAPPTPQAVPVEVAVNPTGADQTAAGGFDVPPGTYVVQVSPIGGESFTESGSLPDATAFVPDPSWVDGSGVPFQLSFGWSASTGASTDYHTISNVIVQTLNGAPPALAVGLTDNSGGTAHSGQIVTYSAVTTLSGSDETRPITMTDTFPTGLVPQTSGLGGSGWTCGVSGPTVSCTTPPPIAKGQLPTVSMPVLVSVPAGPPVSLIDQATAGAPDATQGTGTDTQTYSAAPTATVLSFVTQPVSAQVNTTMKNADSSTTHIRVAADVTAGGADDTTYTGNVTLAFATNPGSAKFVVSGSPASSITVAAVNGVADFSPIIINAVGFGYTLTASATGLTSVTSNSFDVTGVASSCPSGKTCTVTTTSPSTGISAAIVAGAGSGNSIITATFGGNVAAIHPCTGATAGILTFSGNRQKTITLTIPIKQGSLFFCYGQPTPFLDIFLHKTTYFSQANHEFEGLLPVCFKNFTGPCVKSIKFTKTQETVVILSNAADPRAMR
jgi:hypothetical protein